MRNSIAKRANLDFLFLLEHRGFSGTLQFGFDQKELALQIDTYISSKDSSSHSEIKQLSGGEKSYSTACFLFSLWNAIVTPFFCLDEFDVYMVSYYYLLDL